MSKRQSGNTLLNYFSKTPSTPKSAKVENGDAENRKESKCDDADKSVISKRNFPKDESSSEEEVELFKFNLKKRRRIQSNSDSDSEKEKKVLKVAPATPKTPKAKVKDISETEKEAITGDDVNYAHTRLEFLKPENIKDAKGRRPTDPNYDRRTLYVPEKFLSTLSPGVRQWWDLKSHNFDCVLFFKVGKFYELYHMDADIAVKELECTYMRGDFAHSGFPEISYEKMATKLVERGYKVARVEQTETPDMMAQRCKTQRQVTKFDRVVKREICQITNRGTQVPGVQTSFEGDHKPNYMLAIIEKVEETGRTYGVCFIDTAIGEFTMGQFSDDKNASRLRTLISHNSPALILYGKDKISNETQHIIKTVLCNAIKEMVPNTPYIWDAEKAFSNLVEKYFANNEDAKLPETIKEIKDEDGLKSKKVYELCVNALGACIWYMQQCLIDQRVLSMASFKIYTPPDVRITTTEDDIKPVVDHRRYMVLDAITLSNLRLIGGELSLLNTLDQCCTKFGKRLLHFWVCCPSYSVNEIKRRQEAISEFISKNNKADEIRSFLSTLSDFEKQLSQIHGFGARPRNSDHPDSRAVLFEEKIYNTKKIQNFIGLLRGFESLVDIPEKFSEFQSSKLIRKLSQLAPEGEYPDLKPLLEFFENAFDHKEALEQGIIAPEKGVDVEFDSVEEKIENLKTEMQEYLSEQKAYFGCEVKYFGNDKKRFQLEIPENKTKKATSEYFLEGQKKGTHPVRRYNTAETKDFLKRMMQLEDERNKVLKEIAGRIFKQFSSHYAVWKKCLDCIAELDVLLSLAAFTKNQQVVCVPEVYDNSESPFIEIEEGCHPCVATADDFIPNDITIGGESTGSLFLLTGPNMGGKSTLMRQVGLISVLAQMGAHVPARSCRMSLIDRIFTRLGAQDDILAGHSTFLVELNETSSIIKDATKKSLVLLDELGRGTATYDGTAIAVAVANFLADLGCRSIFSTHYHNLIHYFQDDKRVTLGHMSCMVENEDDEDPTQESVTFLYKLAPGACPKSYGFNAAKLAGMPNEITKRASNISKTFMEHSIRKKLFAKILCKSSVPMIRQLIKSQY
ncbi:probable DNA mismatch repair protein Msh6 isoform X2 [Hermetia illucens]|uniref:probable DNA mismatch repair protein Msh6 isoform X2 n=1 Tax=Hermetia illucens TaxID=343691 RepID=UPI0018CC3883|nr:probable DNA mismatch repair protein Msh6 isoform X2 [Hermetia illucens]